VTNRPEIDSRVGISADQPTRARDRNETKPRNCRNKRKMGTFDAPDKSRGVSFQLATGPVSRAKNGKLEAYPGLAKSWCCSVFTVAPVSFRDSSRGEKQGE
jgi:hypothetical protein